MSDALQVAIWGAVGLIVSALISGIFAVRVEVVKKQPSTPADDKKVEKKSLFARIKQRLQPQTILIIVLVSIIFALAADIILNGKNPAPKSPVVITTPTVFESPTVTATPTATATAIFTATPTATATPTTTPTPTVLAFTVLKTFDFEGSAGAMDAALWYDVNDEQLAHNQTPEKKHTGLSSLLVSGRFENWRNGITLASSDYPLINKEKVLFGEAWVYIPESAGMDLYVEVRCKYIHQTETTSYTSYVVSEHYPLKPGEWTPVIWSIPGRVTMGLTEEEGKTFISDFNTAEFKPVYFTLIFSGENGQPYVGNIYVDDITLYK